MISLIQQWGENGVFGSRDRTLEHLPSGFYFHPGLRPRPSTGWVPPGEGKVVAQIRRQAEISTPQPPMLTPPKSLSLTSGEPWPLLGRLPALTGRVTGCCSCLTAASSFRALSLGGLAAGPATASSGGAQHGWEQQQVPREKPANPRSTWVSLHLTSWHLCHCQRAAPTEQSSHEGPRVLEAAPGSPWAWSG